LHPARRQPADNITPVVRRDGVACYGTVLLTLIDAVSARLATGSLRSFGGLVVLDGRRGRSVAEAWPRGQGLMQAGVLCVERQRLARGHRG
jgi:hypothetical protein